jgi:Arc/MetJ-type ribon-helix-helix transcriptional regulator
MKMLTVYFTEFDIEKLNDLVKKGLYPNRAEAIRLMVHDGVLQEIAKDLVAEKVDVDVREAAVEIRENGKVYTVEIMRDPDGSIWGIYPNKPDSPDAIFVSGLRNLFILFRKGILKLEDLPRRKEA